jgi:hypothetical protein
VIVAIQIKAGEVGAVLNALARRIPVHVERGLRVAAERGMTHLREKSPVGASGVYRAAWTVHRELGGWVIENDAPHAGIIERGARPHKVSAEGWNAIYLWVRRVLAWQIKAEKADRRFYFKRRKSLDEIATDITWAIVKKIEKYGQRPRWIVRDSMPLLTAWMGTEIERQMQLLAESAPKSGGG